jgi:hypothetical protein
MIILHNKDQKAPRNSSKLILPSLLVSKYLTIWLTSSSVTTIPSSFNAYLNSIGSMLPFPFLSIFTNIALILSTESPPVTLWILSLIYWKLLYFTSLSIYGFYTVRSLPVVLIKFTYVCSFWKSMLPS